MPGRSRPTIVYRIEMLNGNPFIIFNSREHSASLLLAISAARPSLDTRVRLAPLNADHMLIPYPRGSLTRQQLVDIFLEVCRTNFGKFHVHEAS